MTRFLVPPSAAAAGSIALDDLEQSGATHGDVITWDSVSGAWEPDAPSGGGTPAWDWISETVPTVANAVNIALPSGYDKFRLDLIGIKGAAAVDFLMRLSQNGGSSYLSGASEYPQIGTIQDATTITPYDLSADAVYATQTIAVGTPLHCVFEFFPGAAGEPAAGTVATQRYERGTGTFAIRNFSWKVATTTARCDYVRVYWASSANFAAAGKVVLSGMLDR